MAGKWGSENAPPPWQAFTMANDIEKGNMHFVQKVFEGPFEVSSLNASILCRLINRNKFDILYSSASAGELMTGKLIA